MIISLQKVKNLFQVRLDKKREEKVGSGPQAMFIYWLSQKRYSRNKLLLTSLVKLLKSASQPEVYHLQFSG